MKGGICQYILGVFIAGALAVVPAFALAATLYLAPASGEFSVGQTFSTTVRINTQGVSVNASEGVLAFDPTVLQVVSVSKTGSIFDLNVQEPSFSNTAGTVRWAGIVLNPGFNGASGALLTVTFKGIAASAGQVSFSSGTVLANDGTGTNILSGMSGGTFTIGAAPSPTQAPAAGSAPEVISPTHPEQDAWYANSDPVFEWALPTGVDAVSYLFDPKATANPGNRPDGLISSVTFTDVSDGVTYFHIKFRRNGVWGPIAHVPIHIDTQPPLPFVVTRVDTDPRNRQPQLAYATTDALSGVVRYAMQIDADPSFDVPAASAGQPFTVPRLTAGTHTVMVQAFDAAGNTTEATITLTVGGLPWSLRLREGLSRWGWIGLVLVALVLSYVLGRSHASGRLRKIERRSTRTLSALIQDIDDELALLKKLAADRSLYPEEKYLRTELMHYRKNLKGFAGTHRHLAKKK